MTVTKILEQTLSAGSTSVSFTDADIPNSLIRVYSSNSDLIPVSRILSGNTLTVTYEAQTNAIDVAVEIVKAGLDIVDNLTSTDADKALSAKQGNLLNTAITELADGLDELTDTVNNLDIPDNITDLNDVDVNNIQDGQVIAWNEDVSKFVNVNQSGSNIETITKSMTSNSAGYFTGFTDKDGNLLDPDDCILLDISAVTSSQYYLGLPFVLNGNYLARMFLSLVPSYVEYVKTAMTLDVRYTYIKK